MEAIERYLNALLAVLIACVLFGAFAIQYFYQEEPCPLCLLQRLGMIGVASGALMNCRFGPSKAHYGLSLISAIFGGFVAVRQICLHICPGFSKFGEPFWGLSLYTWSFIVFASSVFYTGLLLVIFDQSKKAVPKTMNPWGHVAFAFVFVAAFANIIATFIECGWSACR